MKRILSVLCIAVIMLTATSCGRNLQGGQPEGEITSNGGIAVQQGDWIYFICGGMPEYAEDAVKDTLRGKICRIKNSSDGSDFEIVSDDKAFNIFLYGDRIFYTTPTKTNVIFSSVKIDGTGKKKHYTLDDGEYVAYGKNGAAIQRDKKIVYVDFETLELTEYPISTDVSGIFVAENYIYYYAENQTSVKRIMLQNGNVEDISDERGPIIYADDTKVFFTAGQVPYKVNSNTLEMTQISNSLYKTILYNEKNSAFICIASLTDDLGLYYQPADNIAGVEVGEGGNKARVKLHSSEVSAFCINDDYIFFVESETGDIYRMDYTGNGKTVLGNVQSVYGVNYIDVAGDNLFVFDSVESGYAYTVPTDGSGSLKVIKNEE